MLNKIENIKETVKQLLTTFPETRDNDELLALKVWALEEPRLRDTSYPFKQFGDLFMQQKFSATESIRRARQKVQEVNKELRGTKYQGRKFHSAEVREAYRQ